MITLLIVVVIIAVILFGPIAIIPVILGYALGLAVVAVTGKIYSTKDFRGYAQKGIRFTNGTLTGKALRNAILTTMEKELKARNIPAKVSTSSAVSSKWFSLKRIPMIVIKNTELGKKYFDIGIVVNDNTVIFPLLGESKENTKNNMHNMYKNEETFWGDVKSEFCHADELKLQCEANWQQDVLECFNKSVLKK